MKKTPLQQVKDEFGSKEALAKKLVAVLDPHEEEEHGEFERRIRTSSNKKLLRLWRAEEALQAGFGSKDALLDAIVKARFDGHANADYRTKIATYATTRLLDLHRQSGGR